MDLMQGDTKSVGGVYYTYYTYNQTNHLPLKECVKFSKTNIQIILSDQTIEHLLYNQITYISYTTEYINLHMKGCVTRWKIELYCSLEEYQWFMRQYELRGKDTDAIEQRMTALEQKLDVLTQIMSNKNL